MNQTKREKLWTSHFLKIMFVSFSIGLCNQIQMTTLPLYAEHIGGSETIAGLMMGIFTLSALLFRPLMGNLLDRIGRRVVLVVGVAIFVAASFSYFFAVFVWLLVVLRLIHGVGFSAYSTSTGTIVADVIPKTRLMEGIGYYGISATMAVALGPALGLYIMEKMGDGALYILTGIVAALGFMAAFWTNYEKAKPLPLSKAKAKSKISFFEKTALKPSLVMFFVALAMASVASFLPMFAYSKGINNIGIFFTANAIVLMFSRPLTGRLSDRIGASKIILPGMMIFVLALVLVPAASTLWAIIVIGALYGLGSGTAFPLLNAITIKLCPAERRGSGNATFLSAVDAGYGFGSIFWGVVSQRFGMGVIFFGAAGSVTIALILYVLTLWKSNYHGHRLINDTAGLPNK